MASRAGHTEGDGPGPRAGRLPGIEIGDGLRLASVSGRRVVLGRDLALAPCLHLERALLEVPESGGAPTAEPGGPFADGGRREIEARADEAAGVHRRRLVARDLTLSLGATELVAWLRAGDDRSQRRVREVEVEISDGVVQIAARMGAPRTVPGGAAAADGAVRADTGGAGSHPLDGGAGAAVRLVARGVLRPIAPRRLGLALFDARAYGVWPEPAWVLASALLDALVHAVEAEAAQPAAAGPPLAWLAGPGAADVELVDVACYELLVPRGWRLPDRELLALREVRTLPARIWLRYGAGEAVGAQAPAWPPGVAERVADDDAGRARHAGAERALLARDLPAALDLYARTEPMAGGDAFAVGRMLQILCAGEATQDEGFALADAALARWPDLPAALLAHAALASRRGRHGEAADLYERLARLADEARAGLEAAAARAAAGDQRALAGAGLAARVTARFTAAERLALAEEAEVDGETEGALAAYTAVLDTAPEGATHVAALVGRARVRMTGGDVAAAVTDLDRALAASPDHAAALALRAEIGYRAQEWSVARDLYARLARVEPGSEIVAAELLAFRTAELAEMFGEEADAEAAYRRVVEMDPRHIEAHEALAEIALLRGDLRAAAGGLERVLDLVPRDALDRVCQTRLRLGDLYMQMEELRAAQAHLDLVVDAEPDREAAIESLAIVCERRGDHRRASELYVHLSRLYADATRRAEALYRQGEILRTKLGDPAGAHEAYLRSSDLDPGFLPTLVRLAAHAWDEGDLAQVRQVGADLARLSTPERLTALGVGLPIALAAAASGDGETVRAAVYGPGLEPESVALRLGELAQRFGRQPPETLDPALDALDQAAPDLMPMVIEELTRRVAMDPAAAGFLAVLGRAAHRQGAVATARAAYGLLLFVDPEFPAADSYSALVAGALADEGVLGPEHPLGRVPGPAAAALRALVPALAGWSRLADAAQPTRTDVEVPGALATLAFRQRRRLGAPSFIVGMQTDSGDAWMLGTRPFTLFIGERVGDLPEAEAVFLVARALDEVRSGAFALAGLSAEDTLDFFRGVAAALGAFPDTIAGTLGGGPGAVGRGVAEHLVASPHAALLPRGSDRADLIEALRAAVDLPAVELQRTALAMHRAAERVALLACGSPLAALRALAAGPRSVAASTTDPMIPVVGVQRQEMLRLAAPLRELTAFLLSPEYRGIA